METQRKTRLLYFIFLHLAVVVLSVNVWILRARISSTDAQGPMGVVPGDLLPLTGIQPANGHAPFNRSAAQLVYIFDSDCGFCDRNMENWNQLHEQLADTVPMVGISLKPEEATAKFIDSKNVKYPVFVVDDYEDFLDQNKANTLPVTAWRLASGVVEKSWMGLLDDQKMQDIIEFTQAQTSG